MKRLPWFSLRTLLIATTVIAATTAGGIAWREHARFEDSRARFETFAVAIDLDDHGTTVRVQFADSRNRYNWRVPEITDAELVHLEKFSSADSLLLDLQGCTNITDDGLTWLKQLSNLDTLTLPEQITSAGLEHLHSLTHLKSLAFSGNSITDTDVGRLHAALPNCQIGYPGGAVYPTSDPDLTTRWKEAGAEVTRNDHGEVTGLDLSRTYIANPGLLHLNTLPALTKIVVSGSFTGSGFVHLKGLDQLQYLDGGDKHADADLVHLKELVNLQTLLLGQNNTQVTNTGLQHLAALTKLETLWLSDTSITDSGLAHLKRLTTLKHLDVHGSMKQVNITDRGLVHLKGLSNLQTLNLDFCRQITDAGLVHLKGLTNLQSLYLNAFVSKVTDAGIAELQKALPECRIRLGYLDPPAKRDTVEDTATQVTETDAVAALEKLGARIERSSQGEVIKVDLFENKKVTDAGMVRLKSLTNLQDLDLRASGITDAGVAHIKNLARLQSLDISRTGITDTGLVHLKGLTNLKKLGLGIYITDVGLVHLKGLTKLQKLDLGGTRVSVAGLVHLKGMTKLQTLNIGFRRITDAGLTHLKSWPNLRELNLKATIITDAGLVHLKGMTKLEMLDLTSNKVTDAGVADLQKALPNCKIEK